MKTTNLFQIDGSPLLVPTAQPVLQYADLASSDSGRDEVGYYHREVLRRRVLTCKLEYSALTDEEYTYLIGLLTDKDTFTLTHPKLASSTETETSTCYCESFSASFLGPGRQRWTALTLEFKQV